MKQVDFDEWWREFLDEQQDDKDGGYIAVDRLRQYISGLDHNKRKAFLDELVLLCIEQKEAWGIAARVLEYEADTTHRKRIYEHLKPLPEIHTYKDQTIIESLTMILATSPTLDFIELIEELLFQRPISQFPHGIP